MVKLVEGEILQTGLTSCSDSSLGGMGRRPLRAWDHFGQIQYRPPTGDFGHQSGAVRNLYSPHFGNDTHNSANSVFAALLSLPVLAIVLVCLNKCILYSMFVAFLCIPCGWLTVQFCSLYYAQLHFVHFIALYWVGI